MKKRGGGRRGEEEGGGEGKEEREGRSNLTEVCYSCSWCMCSNFQSKLQSTQESNVSLPSQSEVGPSS